ncbi:MAG: hypothetical protein QOK21_693 [Solirubrobacteraceae bacterium]|jgi:hypothetical protein|nr:hypothetical protein [Solirubrobacteraceae bacterium]
MSPRALAALVPAALALVAAGCGSSSPASSSSASSSGTPNRKAAEVNPAGDIPDTQVYVRYRPSGATYSVKVPEGWSRTATAVATRFTDKLNSIVMAAHAAASAPTVASVRSHELQPIAASAKAYKPGTVTRVSRTSGTAVLAKYETAGVPNPVTGKTKPAEVERYSFFHKGREVVLTLSGPKGADNVDPWRIVTDSLRWR